MKRKWKPIDLIVIMLSFCIVLILLITVIKYAMLERVIENEESKRLSVVVGSLISIISIYVGAKINKHTKK